MSYVDLSEYTYSAIDADGDAVAFFMLEIQRDEFIKLVNEQQCQDHQLTAGEYIDINACVEVSAS